MSKHLGDFDTSAVIYGKFSVFRPSTGATYTLAGSPALSVYKDNSTTQSTTGITLTVDFDAVTGLCHYAIDTSADGTFYAAGSFFEIVITTGTVDSVSVTGAVVGAFTLRKNSALKPVTAGRALVVDAGGLADANAVKIGPSGSGTAQTARDVGASVLLSAGTGTGQLDFTSGVVKANLAQILGTALTETAGLIAAGFKQFFNVSSPTSTLNRITLVDTVTTYTGNTPQTGDGFARLGAPAGASVSADIATKLATSGYTAPDNSSITAIKAKTDNLPAAPAAVGDIPTANANADALLDRTAGVETSWTLRQALRIMLSSAAAKLSGAATTTVAIRDVGDTKDRITATVDANGNRTAVTFDKS